MSELDTLLEALAAQRRFLRQTVDGLDDEAAWRRSTVSELRLGGIVKHVTAVERAWAGFVVEGPSAIGAADEAAMAAHARQFRREEGDTLAGLLDRYGAAARHTEAVARALPDLDVARPLPEAPWFPPGASWSARRVLLHVLAETAQHAGHADIIREAIDGAKTMG